MSKPCLFVCPWVPPLPEITARAASVRAWQNLVALERLGYDVTIVGDCTDLGAVAKAHKTVRLPGLPYCDFLGLIRKRATRHRAARVIRETMPSPDTVVFCEHFHALLCCPKVPRIIYSCHDMESNLIRLRRIIKNSRVTFRTRLYWALVRHLERHFLRRANAILCVSASEAQSIARFAGCPTIYVPTVRSDVGTHNPPRVLVAPKYWFYGGSGATANKIMLEHFRSVLFEKLAARIPLAGFHQVGSTKNYAPDAAEWLEGHFVTHGFVDDISAILNYGDFCLIPYELDTGFRTKLPEVASYGVIAAGYRESFACCREMVDGKNCIMADGPDQLAEKLAAAGQDDSLRRRLADGALQSAVTDFSTDVLDKRYQGLMDLV